MQRTYSIYIPPSTLFAEKLMTDAHLSTLQWGVILTMTAVREKFWIPKLRRLVKQRIVTAVRGTVLFIFLNNQRETYQWTEQKPVLDHFKLSE